MTDYEIKLPKEVLSSLMTENTGFSSLNCALYGQVQGSMMRVVCVKNIREKMEKIAKRQGTNREKHYEIPKNGGYPELYSKKSPFLSVLTPLKRQAKRLKPFSVMCLTGLALFAINTPINRYGETIVYPASCRLSLCRLPHSNR